MMNDDDYYDESFLRKLFLTGINTRDPKARRQALDVICSVVETWKDALDLDDEAEQASDLLTRYLPTIVRWKTACPFKDVRAKCKEIVESLEGKAIKVPQLRHPGASAFIPESEVISVDTDDEGTRDLFIEAYLVDNRVSNMIRLMGYHPRYLVSFLQFHVYMMHQDGPLPVHLRHYIAILAAARHRCTYLISLCEANFLAYGGDPIWLEDPLRAPKKIRALNHINMILAHQPWLIKPDNIKDLLQPSSDSWSLSELTHALVILAHYHSLAGFALGCGLNPEIDSREGHVVSSPFSSESNSPPVATPRVATEPSSRSSQCEENDDDDDERSPVFASVTFQSVMEKLKQIENNPDDFDFEEPSTEELEKQFETETLASAELGDPHPVATGASYVSPRIAKYVEDPEFEHEDFAKRGDFSGVSTFRVQDFSWEDQGYSLANRLFPDIGQLLDDKFKLIVDLTYRTFGTNVEIDTTMFRSAIWNYIHCIKGIFHDDYNYGEVNKMLHRDIKKYIRNVTCFPERTIVNDFNLFLAGFHYTEKVHVNLLLLEARLQAELLYALRAIMRYMT
ncbi:sestrin-1-like [Oscarella lobularis]|uniref:sestrin-1-like n=1 Tax=Oscarella lobularis TaxID=121494 RepID=UPI0033134168